MQAEQTAERIKEFILDHFPLARKRGLRVTDQLLESGVVDSLGVIDLVTFMEQEFSIIIVDEELVPENFQTIEQLAAFVRSKCHEAAAA